MYVLCDCGVYTMMWIPKDKIKEVEGGEFSCGLCLANGKRKKEEDEMILKNKEDKWGKVFIDEDLNWEERRKRIELRAKLKEMREKGVYCFLDRGRIRTKGYIKDRVI